MGSEALENTKHVYINHSFDKKLLDVINNGIFGSPKPNFEELVKKVNNGTKGEYPEPPQRVKDIDAKIEKMVQAKYPLPKFNPYGTIGVEIHRQNIIDKQNKFRKELVEKFKKIDPEYAKYKEMEEIREIEREIKMQERMKEYNNDPEVKRRGILM